MTDTEVNAYFSKRRVTKVDFFSNIGEAAFEFDDGTKILVEIQRGREYSEHTIESDYLTFRKA
jgi:hypothetical protein